MATRQVSAAPALGAEVPPRASEPWSQAKRGAQLRYPIRCVFVHQKVKEEGLSEFIRRCVEKRGQEQVAPEVVMLLGPPAAGKSSIQRLSLDEMPSPIQSTAKSLRFREEVSNDNLCAPRWAKHLR